MFVNTLSISTVGFLLLSKFIKSRQDHIKLVQKGSNNKWLYRNTFCSFVHSTLSAFWTIYCYVDEPKLLDDMVNTKSVLSIALIMFSTGYFIYDFVDIIIHDKLKQWELIFHHIAVLSAFGIALYQEKYIGFGCCALIMEFNSIFLHLRRLFKMCGMQSSRMYSWNSAFLLLSMVFCRICTSAWMVKWLLQNRTAVPYIPYLIGTVGMTVMTATNIGLMYRLCISECYRKKVSVEIKK